MLQPWMQDLECLEAITRDDAMREVLLRMAGLARGGRLGTFSDVVAADTELDATTKDWVLELAGEESFLLAVEAYVDTCRHFH